MFNFLETVVKGCARVAFPHVCVCCGTHATERERHICSFCLKSRFQPANPDGHRSASGIIMPEGVRFQHALWNFDHGGAIQHLMHMLKYEHLTEIGIQLGRRLGLSLQELPCLFPCEEDPVPMLIPVPLHYLKYRRRGFNQSFKIARGIACELPLPICDIRTVVRIRNTRSQTGYSLSQRIKNVEGAFRVRDPGAVRDRAAIIVDDVFTTGATAFELAGELRRAGSYAVAIATVAQA
ncbi:MAG: ComF family protein [Balneolaceae bacterium]|nr:ComF family protein [Balneolaceae bacterium]